MISNYLTNKFLRGFMLGKDTWLITIIYFNKKERFCPDWHKFNLFVFKIFVLRLFYATKGL